MMKPLMMVLLLIMALCIGLMIGFFWVNDFGKAIAMGVIVAVLRLIGQAATELED